jgi:hypothetical protein
MRRAGTSAATRRLRLRYDLVAVRELEGGLLVETTPDQCEEEIFEDGACCFEDPDCDEDWLESAEIVEEPPESQSLAPARLLSGSGAIVRTYNRLGGLMEELARERGLDVALVLAVWHTESRGAVLVPGQAVIRFENHKLWNLWGKKNQKKYNEHWKHQTVGELRKDGTRDRVKPWKGHFFRTNADTPWLKSHVASPSGQRVEYACLAQAIELAGEELALTCISIGGPQVLIKHFKILGYPTARAMYDDWQSGEGPQVRGFFAFCDHEGATKKLQAGDLPGFIGIYNGTGQVPEYLENIGEARGAARAALNARV